MEVVIVTDSQRWKALKAKLALLRRRRRRGLAMVEKALADIKETNAQLRKLQEEVEWLTTTCSSQNKSTE